MQGELLAIVNANASGVESPEARVRAVVALLEEAGGRASGAVTGSEAELADVLGRAAGRRVVLVGGDGSLHAAANAPLRELPELALLPAGRANNVARALGIPTSAYAAARIAVSAPARALDLVRVDVGNRSLYAVEALSAGFQAEARSLYADPNSANLTAGLGALWRALRSFSPHRAALRVDGEPVVVEELAQLFVSNLPYFGFGFPVAPGADPGDGALELIVYRARRRARLLRLLAATWRGRHLARAQVDRRRVRDVRLELPLPLVADAEPLGTGRATARVERGRMRIAAPPPGARQ